MITENARAHTYVQSIIFPVVIALHFREQNMRRTETVCTTFFILFEQKPFIRKSLNTEIEVGNGRSSIPGLQPAAADHAATGVVFDDIKQIWTLLWTSYIVRVCLSTTYKVFAHYRGQKSVRVCLVYP